MTIQHPMGGRSHERALDRAAQVVLELHTPWDSESGLPRPAACPDINHRPALKPGDPEHCVVLLLRRGEHAWFGSHNPVAKPKPGRKWLQVGKLSQRHRLSDDKLISGVTGHIWSTEDSGETRVLIENLSRNVTVIISSPELPVDVSLYPVRDHQQLRPGTPIAAIQASRSTLALDNGGQLTPVWARLRSLTWQDRPLSQRTSDPGQAGSRDVKNWSDKDHEAQTELDEAAYRILLATPERLPLLQEFLAEPAVQGRLEGSPTLRKFLADPKRKWELAHFIGLQLRWIRERKPSNDIHRLILEARGTPPERRVDAYTNLVRDQIRTSQTDSSSDDDRVPGGPHGGMADLIARVRAYWPITDAALTSYLHNGSHD